MILLFLDFDGVLHPAQNNGRNNFCHLSLFESVVRDFPEVSIVISSSWRLTYPLNELKAFFSNDIAARIIAATGERNGMLRHVEISQYLEQSGLKGTPWIVLDDNVFGFPASWHNIIWCDGDIGLTPTIADKLRQHLKKAQLYS